MQERRASGELDPCARSAAIAVNRINSTLCGALSSFGMGKEALGSLLYYSFETYMNVESVDWSESWHGLLPRDAIANQDLRTSVSHR